VSLLNKHMHELGIQNELTQYHCIIKQHPAGKALPEIVSAINTFRSRGLNRRQFKGTLTKSKVNVETQSTTVEGKVLQCILSLLEKGRKKDSPFEDTDICRHITYLFHGTRHYLKS
jgi:hypothetical protein